MGDNGMKACPDEKFISLFESLGATQTAKRLGVTERNVYARRRNLERSLGHLSAPTRKLPHHPGRYRIEIKNGSVIIGSDLHIWPGEASTCLRALKKLTRDIQPSAVILNGDVMDFPRISRHPQNWEKAPDPQEEIEAAQDHLNDIVSACKRGTHKIWTQGNHDARMESLFANATPQMRGLKGIHLHEHFAVWQRAMSCFINEGTDSATMVKHRLAGGQHATYNNVKRSGTNIVTGHLHAQNVRCVSDYRTFDLYGVDSGCVADKEHRAFLYTEDAPLDWRSGFVVLTFRDGRLLMPQLVKKWDEKNVEFMGQLIRV